MGPQTDADREVLKKAQVYYERGLVARRFDLTSNMQEVRYEVHQAERGLKKKNYTEEKKNSIIGPAKAIELAMQTFPVPIEFPGLGEKTEQFLEMKTDSAEMSLMLCRRCNRMLNSKNHLYLQMALFMMANMKFKEKGSNDITLNRGGFRRAGASGTSPSGSTGSQSSTTTTSNQSGGGLASFFKPGGMGIMKRMASNFAENIQEQWKGESICGHQYSTFHFHRRWS